jgi:hypothetical protein
MSLLLLLIVNAGQILSVPPGIYQIVTDSLVPGVLAAFSQNTKASCRVLFALSGHGLETAGTIDCRLVSSRLTVSYY